MELEQIAKKIAQTKQRLGYLPIYGKYFKKFKNKKINILEIGIDKGHSIKLWSKYFSKANIVGIDIEKSNLNIKNAKFFFGNQSDTNFLQKIVKKYKKFHIIIDDGSHKSKDIIRSFNFLFDHLSNGGLYVVEDLVTSYLPRFGGSRVNLLKKNTSMNMLKSLCDSVNYEQFDRPFYKKKKFDGIVKSIYFSQNICFIEKGISKNYHYKKKSYSLKDYVRKIISLFF